MEYLEDDQMMLNTYATNRFAQPFAHEVAHWTVTLASMSETVSTWLTVQVQKPFQG